MLSIFYVYGTRLGAVCVCACVLNVLVILTSEA